MQQVFIWSQALDPPLSLTRSHYPVIGHNPFFINLPTRILRHMVLIDGKWSLQINLLALPLHRAVPAMKRPVGLILSAILLSVAALPLLLTALAAFAASSQHQPSLAAMPHFALYLMLAVSAFYAVLAIWAIFTVIGILRLRSWGRYSILIIDGGLAVIGVLADAFTLLFSRTMLPAFQAQQPTANPHLISFVLMAVAAFYLLIAAIRIW